MYKKTIAHSEIVLQNDISKIALESLMYSVSEWYQYQEITDLTLYLPPYTQGRIQEQASQWILPQTPKMKLLGMQSHKN